MIPVKRESPGRRSIRCVRLELAQWTRGQSGRRWDATRKAQHDFRSTLATMALLVLFALTYWPWMGYMTKPA
ncbi:hypothetical protein FN976_04060 [Caenimonas sedimenti]|uniref:Uncharacterized protein n=1 Tax=Caenimonas sedimenti TaxID=2596921 RepID=A0A562ZVS5_9BURK|nr:hypothetical protein FN976_04060 [Caenimonas sedimenti]